MDAKHTPGPWISQAMVEGVPPKAGCGVIASDEPIKISNPSRGIVAWATRRVGQNNTEVLANARLIAAAPELAEALQDVMGRLEINTAGNWDAFVRASSALTKAGFEEAGP